MQYFALAFFILIEYNSVLNSVNGLTMKIHRDNAGTKLKAFGLSLAKKTKLLINPRNPKLFLLRRSNKKRKVNYTKLALTALSFLRITEKRKIEKMLQSLCLNFDTRTHNSTISKITINNKPMYSINVNVNLRLLFEVTDTEIVVHDIVNHRLCRIYVSSNI